MISPDRALFFDSNHTYGGSNHIQYFFPSNESIIF